MSSSARLVADIGGTNARVAIANHSDHGWRLDHIWRQSCADYTDVNALFASYQSFLGDSLPDNACVAAAGPVLQDRISMTNLPWAFSRAELQQCLDAQTLYLVNDFVALARSIPELQAQDKVVIKPGENIRAPILVIGPGTGLGVAVLIETATGWEVLSSEGGHMSLSATDDQQSAVLHVLQKEFGYTNVEMVLSGAGLARLDSIVRQIENAPEVNHSAQQVVSLALSGEDAYCLQTVQLFVKWLAQVASDMALVYGALGGVYLSGGVLSNMTTLLSEMSFPQYFINKHNRADYLQSIPVQLITHPMPALVGAAAYQP